MNEVVNNLVMLAVFATGVWLYPKLLDLYEQFPEAPWMRWLKRRNRTITALGNNDEDVPGFSNSRLTHLTLSCVNVMTVAAAVFLTLGALLAGLNFIGILQARRKQVGFSCIPILGGLLGSVGFLLLPRFRLFALIPPLVDPGCVLMIALLVLRKIPAAPPTSSRR
jgi:hypothetical protein